MIGIMIFALLEEFFLSLLYPQGKHTTSFLHCNSKYSPPFRAKAMLEGGERYEIFEKLKPVEINKIKTTFITPGFLVIEFAEKIKNTYPELFQGSSPLDLNGIKRELGEILKTAYQAIKKGKEEIGKTHRGLNSFHPLASLGELDSTSKVTEGLMTPKEVIEHINSLIERGSSGFRVGKLSCF